MTDEIIALLTAAEALPFGHARIELVHEAVRRGEGEVELESLFELKSQLCTAAALGGRPELALVTFTECLNLYDKNQELLGYQEHPLLWNYKIVAGGLHEFPTISMQQIEAAEGDFAKRLERAGYSVRPVHGIRMKRTLCMGRLEESVANFHAWQSARIDEMGDCIACEVDNEVSYHCHLKQWTEALAAAQPILKGRMRCAEIPQRTYPSVMLASLELGDIANAKKYAMAGVKITRPDSDLLPCLAGLIKGLVRLEELSAATRVFEKSLPWALKTFNLMSRLEVYVAGRNLTDAILAGSGDIRFRLPKEVGANGLGNRRTASEVSVWLREQIDKLAAQFDRRNGDELFSRRLLGESRD